MDDWQESTRKRLEASKNWDMTKRQNRREVRQIKRRLFWGRWGALRAVLVGGLVGGTIGMTTWIYALKPMIGGL